MKIGLVVRPEVEAAVTHARELLTWCARNNHEVVLEHNSAEALDAQGWNAATATKMSAAELAVACDPVVSLGGDGTLIGVAHFVQGRSPVILGVNFGTLGFLTEISPTELIPTLESVLAGTALCGERAMLQAEIVRDGKVISSTQGVNDVVVQKGARSRLLDLDLFVDREAVMRLRADGLIIATPTGSTAYSLAAGGSIMHPSLSVVMVTPICPHSLGSRPLILRLGSEIRIDVPPYDGKCYLTVDGQMSVPLRSGDAVRVTESPNRVRFVRSSKRSYFEILRAKLNWGLPNCGDA